MKTKKEILEMSDEEVIPIAIIQLQESMIDLAERITALEEKLT